jgi:hypothetical protein
MPEVLLHDRYQPHALQMKYIMFQDRFGRRILDGVKVSTIRPTQRFEPGEEASLRVWKGKPYRSKQFEFALAKILEVNRLIFCKPFEIACEGRFLTMREITDLARDEGFNSATEMFQWFEDAHGLPFKGFQYRFCVDRNLLSK